MKGLVQVIPEFLSIENEKCKENQVAMNTHPQNQYI